MYLKKFIVISFWLFASVISTSLAGECAPFYCSFDSETAITQCNGTVNGVLTFPIAVNGMGANFNGTVDVKFTGQIFDTPAGSLSLWLKKNSSDQKGGIMEIGRLGTPNSMGIFYANSDYVYFEIRNAANEYRVVYAPDVLSQDAYTHIVVIWYERQGIYHMKLFINGIYAGGERLPAPFVHANGFMNVGVSGSGEWYGRGRGIIDEMRFFNWALSDPEVYAEYVYSSNRYRYQPTGKPVSTGPVKVIGKTLSVYDKPFLVKAVGYQPVPIGMSPTKDTLDYILTDQNIIQRDVEYLKKMNVNTIRLWVQLPDTTLLDVLASAGIYAIMGFYIPASTDVPNIDYSDPATIQLYANGIADYVNQFKNHPAVLAWAIGNENNLHYNKNVADWYKLANKLAQVAYETEKPAYHPTILVNGYMLFFADIDHFSDDASLNYVDIWGHNTYVCYDYHSYFCYYDKVTAKPLIMTEFGVDAYGSSSPRQNQHLQAEWVVHEWNQIRNNCLGGVVMEYCDEWWKCGSPSTQDLCGYYTDVQPDFFSNEEWYGIMAVEKGGASIDIMRPREIYCTLQQAYSDRKFVGDIAPDGNVDFGDFSIFSGRWQQTNCYEDGCCEGADLDHSGEVDIGDLSIMSEDWLEGG
jgi:hypothetical protein